MTGKLGTVGFVVAAGALAASGCASLEGDPLSPPHVRYAACATENVEQAMEEKLSPEYQEWLGEVKHFWRDTQREFADEYHKNEYWPQPYSTLAQYAVRQPLDLQAENARQQLTTLWDYHFEGATGKLNAMGRKRLQDIVNQSGAWGHAIFVQRSPSADETTLRLAEVRKELDHMELDGVTYDVAESRANPTLVIGEEAKQTIKLLTEPPKKQSADKQGSSGGGYSTSGSSGGQ